MTKLPCPRCSTVCQSVLADDEAVGCGRMEYSMHWEQQWYLLIDTQYVLTVWFVTSLVSEYYQARRPHVEGLSELSLSWYELAVVRLSTRQGCAGAA
jgi:hypothetical protein